MIFDNDQNKNVALECQESVRYLGVIIDYHLSWKNHIDHVAIKLSRTVGLICKLRGGSRGRVQGVRTPLEMKPSSSYWLLKFVYLTGQ